MKTCDVLLTTNEGQLVAGTIVLDGGHVFGVPVQGYEALLQNILESPVVGPHGKFFREKTPVGWFEGLPYQYNGSRLKVTPVKSELKQ